MIKAIREAFDDFVIAARIKPAITAGIPLLLMVFFNGVVKCKWMEAGIGLALSLVVISFAAYIVRELGKTYEEKFYKALGGMPTTIILRFSNDTIDDITKVIIPNTISGFDFFTSPYIKVTIEIIKLNVNASVKEYMNIIAKIVNSNTSLSDFLLSFIT